MGKRKTRYIFGLIIILLLIGIASNLVFQKLRSHNSRAATPLISLSVRGNRLVDGNGTPVNLYGVDLGGTQLDCTKGNPTLYDTTIDSSFMAALESWHVNAVRIVLNEDCWLGINGVEPSVSGAAYQNFVKSTVSTMNSAGIVVLLSLARALPGTQEAGIPDGTGPLPDSDHSLAFWTQVASTFANTPGVIFGAYGEPEHITWDCWLNGCQVASPAGGTYQGVGMQELVNTIRATGANQPIMLGGITFSQDLTGWLANKPSDPDNQLVASFHNYDVGSCNTYSCWNSTIAPVAASVPVITDEIGESDCTPDYVDKYMSWADKNNVSYLAWSWQIQPAGECNPDLLTSYDGSPTVYGAGYQAQLDSLWSSDEIVNFVNGSSGGGGGSGTQGGSSTTSSGSTSGSSKSTSSSSSSKTSSKTPSNTKVTPGSSPTTGLSSSGNITPNKATKPFYKKVSYQTTGAVLVCLIAGGAVYWLILRKQGSKLKVVKTGPPLFFKITKANLNPTAQVINTPPPPDNNNFNKLS